MFCASQYVIAGEENAKKRKGEKADMWENGGEMSEM